MESDNSSDDIDRASETMLIKKSIEIEWTSEKARRTFK